MFFLLKIGALPQFLTRKTSRSKETPCDAEGGALKNA
jgi:hypothetical protein